MAVTTLNNNDIATVVNSAIAQATGAADIATLDLEGIIDAGNDSSVIGSVEQFTKSLINVLIKNWFTDSKYRSEYFDPFFEDSEKYGAIIQAISVEVPAVKASSAWQDFGTGSGQVSTVGTYAVYLPVVHSQYYGKTVSWELPITITGEQWDTAFKNAEELRGFVAYILMCVDNALVCHLEDMNNMNRNNFMAEKINYAGSQGATGIHVVNLVEKYVKEMGDPTADYTVEKYLSNVNAMRHGSEKIRLMKKYFQKMSTSYNTAGRRRFTPEDRIVLQVLSFFEERMATVALSDTYHKDIVEMPGFQSVAYWQGFGDDENDFDDISAIDVEIGSDGTKVTKSGIVAFMADKWAVLHTIKSRRVAAKVFEPENLTNYYYQFRDMYMNDLTMNAVVFVLEDYKAPTTQNSTRSKK